MSAFDPSTFKTCYTCPFDRVKERYPDKVATDGSGMQKVYTLFPSVKVILRHRPRKLNVLLMHGGEILMIGDTHDGSLCIAEALPGMTPQVIKEKLDAGVSTTEMFGEGIFCTEEEVEGHLRDYYHPEPNDFDPLAEDSTDLYL